MKTKILVATLCLAAACGGDRATGGDGIASVRMNANSLTLLSGQTAQLSATALASGGAQVSGAPAATWRSTAAGVATVSADGLVSAVAIGAADIIATISGVNGTTRVTVGQPVLAATVLMPGLSFTPFTTVLKVGGTVTFEFPQTPHNVIFVAKAGVPTDILVMSNVRIARTFLTVGSFPYDCTLHPGMQGEVNVVP